MMDYQLVALVLFLIGVACLGAEILLPTGGFLVVAALLFFACGVGTILYYGTGIEAAVAIAGLAVGLPAAGFVAVHAYRRMAIGGALESGIAEASAITMPQIVELEGLKGRVGKTATPMRPSGAVEFDARRVDAMSEGMMIEAGTWVRCVDVKGGKVVVREMDAPSDITDINLDEPKPPKPDSDFDLELDR